MIISRESRKSRKIIHRYRSYVAVRMANASEMMRFRVICEIRVRQKSCVKREYFYNAYSLVDEIRRVTAVLLVKAQCLQPNRIHHSRCLFAKGQMRYCYSTGLMS